MLIRLYKMLAYWSCNNKEYMYETSGNIIITVKLFFLKIWTNYKQSTVYDKNLQIW